MEEPRPSAAPAKLKLESISGDSYSVRDWLTSYPFLLVAIDPYTIQSSWILDTATRIFHHYTPADVRVGWICTADVAGCKEFLGPLADKYLTFTDPNREAVKALGIEHLPSLVHIRSDGFLQTTDGWDAQSWGEVCDWLSKILAWTELNLGKGTDPGSYSGTPVTADST